MPQRTRKSTTKIVNYGNSERINKPGVLLPVIRCRTCHLTIWKCNGSGCKGTKEFGWREKPNAQRK